jgi:hypothetical protein
LCFQAGYSSIRQLKSATPINRKHTTKVDVRNYALLFFGCLLFHLVGTWSLPLIDRDEPRFAEASREMIERGDYLVPHFNNQLRLDKPPFTYWVQVASYKIFGENDFAARFPSAVAAALIALSVFARGSRISGERVGWSAAIIFTLCLQTFIHAKAAVADMWLALFVTTAHWSGFELLRDGLTSDKGKTRFSRKRADCVDAFVDGWIDNFLCSSFAPRPPIQIHSWHCTYACDHRSLGSPSIDSN